MYIYIKKSIIGYYFESDILINTIDGYQDAVGATLKDFDNGKFVLLSQEQVQFHIDNPNASIEEVFNTQLNKPELLPEESERTLDDAKKDLHNQVDSYAESKRVFYVNGSPVWFSSRANMKLQVDAEIAYNKETVTLYDDNGDACTLSVDDANNAIIAVEHYNTELTDFIQNLHNQIDDIPSLEFADNIDINDYIIDAPPPLEFTHPEEPEQKDFYNVQYKTANCIIDNDITSVAAGDRWKSSIYPEDGLALYIPDFTAEMGGKPIDVTFEPDTQERKEYASSARMEIDNVTGDIFVASLAR